MAKKKQEEKQKFRYQLICHNCGRKEDTNELSGCSCGNKRILVNDHDKLTSGYRDL